MNQYPHSHRHVNSKLCGLSQLIRIWKWKLILKSLKTFENHATYEVARSPSSMIFVEAQPGPSSTTAGLAIRFNSLAGGRSTGFTSASAPGKASVWTQTSLFRHGAKGKRVATAVCTTLLQEKSELQYPWTPKESFVKRPCSVATPPNKGYPRQPIAKWKGHNHKGLSLCSSLHLLRLAFWLLFPRQPVTSHWCWAENTQFDQRLL